MFSILVVEDDDNARRLMETVLRRGGYEAIIAADGAEALERMRERHVDLAVVDLMMPRMDGYEFTEALRRYRDETPVLMVTAMEGRADKRRGFVSGADDYMVKPVDEEELLLRIKALLRRARIASERRLEIGGTTLDYDSMTVTRGGRVAELPAKEFALLYKLLSYPGKIFTRRALMDELWDENPDSDQRTVDVHVNRLRDRFSDNPDFQIVTVRGLGYKAAVSHE
ncbi:MAG TPA: response regulator transcription factor [Spirochaetia bacterium]|nr:response regulator transcription factor [Spirochaetales bacterium]HQO67100.1 response regulator transcription factor [Spirochaetales bacterium]HRW25544.1 response regulator transcription factor [Spirochaetia bacterium]